jgi:ADP-ribosylation factor-like protein 2
LNEDVNTVSPTLGFIIRTIDFKGFRLNIWDVGGQKTIRSYWRNYFEKTDALIWVVDATDRLRIDDCRAELRGLLLEEVSHLPVQKWALLIVSQRQSGSSLLIFLNKTDISGGMSVEEVSDALQLRQIHTHRWTVFPSSAMTGQNLEPGLGWVVKDVQDRNFGFGGQ